MKSIIRHSLNAFAIALVTVTLVSRAAAQAPAAAEGVDPADLELTPSDKAVQRGLKYLASKQNPDGSFHKIVGVNALCVMAFLASGHVPGEGPYHEVVEKGIKYIVSQQGKDGVMTGGGGRMYGHGMATLLLGEIVGMTNDDTVKKALPKAVDVILRAQAVAKPINHAGGWRYEPTSKDSDLSATGWQMIALRAAKDSGIEVSKEVMDKAIAYVKRCAAPAGGFGYVGPGSAPSTTAVGMVCLQMAGEGEAGEVWKAANVLIANPKSGWFYYTIYYGTFAMYQIGGKFWTTWKTSLEATLLPSQQADGSFPAVGSDGGHGGVMYSTAMALLALSVQYHYLPAYQR